MSGVAIVSGCRTPIGDLNKSLSSIPPSELGGTAISGALSRAGVQPSEVNLCVMGQVLYAGEGWSSRGKFFKWFPDDRTCFENNKLNFQSQTRV